MRNREDRTLKAYINKTIFIHDNTILYKNPFYDYQFLRQLALKPELQFLSDTLMLVFTIYLSQENLHQILK